MKKLYSVLCAILLSFAAHATLPPITGTGTVCSGGTTTLTNATPGGTWNCASIFATVDPSTGIVTGTSAGTATISYTLGADVTTTIVTVNAALTAMAPMQVCEGSIANVNPGASGGMWSSSNTAVGTVGTSHSFSGLSAGTTTITYTLSPGCFVTRSMTVIAGPASITGTASLCQGSTTTLFNATPGGVWSTNNPIFASVDPTTGVVTGIAQNTVLIKYTLANGCEKSIGVTIAGASTPIAGSTTICNGSTSTLSYYAPGGTWTSSNPAIANINLTSGLLTGYSLGTSVITYTHPSCSSTITTTVTVNSTPPPITGITSICYGMGTLLANAMPGGTWSSSNVTVAAVTGSGANPGGVSGVAAGTSTIVYAVPGCGNASTIVTVQPMIPAIADVPYCASGTFTLSNPMPGGTWSSSNPTAASVGSSSGVVTILSSPYMNASINYTLPTGCSKSASFYIAQPTRSLEGCNNIGVGDTLFFGGNGYWTSTNTGVAQVYPGGAVRGMSVGTAVISYYPSIDACWSYAKTINVTPVTMIRQMTGNNVLCPGMTTLLTDVTGGGTWSSSDPGIASISSSGMVTAVASGMATITYAIASPYHCTRSFYVNSNPNVTGPSNVCAGQTVALYSGEAYAGFGMANTYVYFPPTGGPGPILIDGPFPTGHTYTSSNPGIASIISAGPGTVRGVSAGVANITITSPLTSCSTVVPLTVDPTVVTPISGTLATCIGGTSTLTNTTPGGTWSSSNTTKATIHPTSGVVTGVATGASTITYDVGSTCGKVFAEVSVNPIPAAITGIAGPKCVSSSFTAVNAVPGGTWSSSNPSVATVDAATGVVNCLALGSTIITYTSGPCGNYVTSPLSVVSSYPITGPANFCNGSTTTLATGGSGTWSSSNTAVATVGITGVVTSVAAGTAIITFTPAACAASIRTVSVYALSPITGMGNACVGSPTVLSTAATGGVWSSSVPARAIVSTSGVVTPVTSGGVNISYSMPTGCYSVKPISISFPPVAFNITGGGTYCTGGTGLAIGLSGITGSTSYQLYRNGVATGSPVTTNTFGPQTLPGSYSAIATNTSGCSEPMYGTATISVTPTVAPIAGPSTICMSTAAILSNATTGGTWSSTTTGVATVNSNTGVALAVSTGTTTIRYTTACGMATHVITVDAAVPAITGVAPVCQGASITLSNTATGGTWSSSAAGTIDATTGVLTGAAAGVATIVYTATNGCTKTTNVTVNTIPTITVPSALCVGGTVSLTTTGGTGGTWVSSNPSVGTITTPGSLLGVGLGSANISYTSTAGCTGTNTFNVSVACSGMPTAGTAAATVSSCPGSTVALTLTGHTSACGITLQWQSSPDGSAWTDIPGASTASCNVTPASSTWYRGSVSCTSSFTSYSTPVLVPVYSNITGHSIASTSPSLSCDLAHFVLTACSYSTSSNVTTYFGDGTSDNTPLILSAGTAMAHVYHSYSLPGTYTIKQVLFNGTTAADSVVYSYSHLYCNTLYVGVFNDLNTNCLFDNSDILNMHAVSVAIDSNGVPLDTLAITSGLLLNTYGPPGTVYGFRLVSVSGGRIAACPSTGVLYDTISSTPGAYPVKYFGLQCAPSADFDLSENVTFVAGTALANGTIYISNSHCTPKDPVVTMSFSPKYHFNTSVPAPTSISGNTVRWDLPTVSSIGVPTRVINVQLLPSLTLIPGDTVNSSYSVTPVTGDINTTNNYINRTNIIVGSFDPNDIDVSPRGKILPCETLTYTVRFENMGNDTARNIFVLDTLPPNVDPHSLNVVMASANMNVAVTNDGIRNIARFEFPGINLLDSSYHGQCQGMFIFNVKARSPLSDGTMIDNRVGIYFDDNAPVLTNTVSNTIGIEDITGPAEVCQGAAVVLNNATPAGTWSSSAGVTVTGGTVTGVTHGNASVRYTVSNSCASRVATHTITVNSSPTAEITGATDVCVGGTSTLAHPNAGGIWASGDAAIATVNSSGIVSGISVGTATISYSSASACGSATTTTNVTVNALPEAGTMGSPAVVCESASVTIATSATGGNWTYDNDAIAIINSAGLMSGISAGTTRISYTVTNGCGTDVFTTIATVNANPDAGIISGSAEVCAGTTSSLTTSGNSGTWATSDAAIASVSAAGLVTGIAAGTVSISYTTTNSCGTDISTIIATVTPLPVAGSISGTAGVCIGASAVLTASIPGGAWESSDVSVATVNSAGEVTGVLAGTASISYKVNNTCGSAIATTTATVNPSPDAGMISGPMNVCEGSSATFATSATGGMWTTSDALIATIGSSGLLTGMASGTTNIQYTVTNGCGTDIATAAVYIDQLPFAGVIGGLPAVCAGSVTTLTSSVHGGTWTTGDASIATVSSTGIVSGVAAGSAAISYSVVNGCGTDVATEVFHVNPLPDAGVLSGSTVLCKGTTTTLASSVPGGVWTSGDISIASVGSTGIVTGLNVGTPVISYSVSNSCGTNIQTITTQVRPLPDAGTITGVHAICEGASALLTSTITGGSWNSGSTATATISNSGITTGKLAGTVMVSYSVTNSCGTDVAIHLLTIDRAYLPVVAINAMPSLIIGGGTPVTFSAAIKNGGTSPAYQWTVNSTRITGATNAVYSTANLADKDSISCLVTSASNDCTYPGFNSVIVHVSTKTMELSGPDALTLFPNPNTGMLNIRGYVGRMDKTATITIINTLGQTVHEQRVALSDGNMDEHVAINSTLPNGTYMVRVTGLSESVTMRFALQR